MKKEKEEEIVEKETNEEIKKKNYTPLKIIIIIILLITSIILYSRYIGTIGLNIKEYKITNEKIPETFHGIKVVQISDLYIGNTTSLSELKKIVTKINKIKPDIVIYTGTIYENESDDATKNNIFEILNSINTNIGSFALAEENTLELFKKYNIININEKEEIIYNNSKTPIILTNKQPENNEGIFKILVTKSACEINNYTNIDLALSSNTKDRLINIPFINSLLVKEENKDYLIDHKKINNIDSYISSGIGTPKDFKYRLFNKPSINLYRLTRY